MLIVALVLAVIGLAALVTAVVTSNELIAWICIGASVVGVVLLIVDAVRERSSSTDADADDSSIAPAEDYPEELGSATDASSDSDAEPARVSHDGSDDGSDDGHAKKPDASDAITKPDK